jgi:enoyl-CoA hydratase/carnithine racemase
MTLKTLSYEVRERVAYITFTTPKRLNSISESRLTDLEEVMDRLESDSSLHAVTITGEGRAFCVGLDLDLLKQAFEDMAYFGSIVRRLNEIILRLEQLDVPVVAVVNGFARAGGFEIALGCDLILMANEAKIGDNHTHVGVMPGGGSTQRLPRRIGAQAAKDLIWSARWLSGPEAVACGLALRSVPLERLAEETETLLAQFRDKPRAVLSVVKKTIQGGEGLSIRDGVELEIRNFLDYMGNQPYPREMFWASIKDKPARQPS